MKVLVIGSGAREHSIAKKLADSKKISAVYISPGNPGMSGTATLVDLSNFDAIRDFCLKEKIGFVFVGPEQPLSEGLADFLEQNEIPVIGPIRDAARIESSKSFAKELMHKYRIPTADYKVFGNYSSALSHFKNFEFPAVIKADGLAAGKGVVIVEDFKQAEKQLSLIFKENIFGSAGKAIVAEEYLSGWECSIFAFCDQESFVSTIFSQDHKRLLNNDMGPNTGGMGAYAPVKAAEEFKCEVDEKIFKRVLHGLKQEGVTYKGVLYAGLMITADGPKVIEFNCRFGDPETQVVLPLLKTDLADICLAILNNRVNEIKLEWEDKYAVGVVLASDGYPGKYEKNLPLTIGHRGLDEFHSEVYFAGVGGRSGSLITSGGRVATIVAKDTTITEAIKKAYASLDYIDFPNKIYRTDIGYKAL